MEVSLSMKLNPNKRIGKVLYLVEGDVDEVRILEHVFNKVLNYSIVSYDKRNDGVTCLIKPNDKYSRVFIVPMKYSAISKILSSSEYLDYIYSRLKSFGLEKDECAKYLIFDRDNSSNKHETIESLFKVFKNSLDNDLEINGLLLISYPCVQSFLCECFDDQTRLSTSALMKQYCNKYSVEDIDQNKLLTGMETMMKTLLSIILQPSFNVENLDDMERINTMVLNYQDDHLVNKHVYVTLSMLFISFVDLGIIEL